jgi:type IX secretion system PorP/SprF family membrane protein
MNTKFIGILFVFFTSISFAQQDAQYTQYMYNTSIINPAYAGSRETLSVFGLHRSQWVGIEGAPSTNNFSINSPIGRNVGLGLTVVNDKIGPADENNFAVDFAYRFNISENYQLSFGIKGSAPPIVIVTKHENSNPTK